MFLSNFIRNVIMEEECGMMIVAKQKQKKRNGQDNINYLSRIQITLPLE